MSDSVCVCVCDAKQLGRRMQLTSSGAAAWVTTVPLSLKEKKVKVAQSCSTLCDPLDYTVHGILQARIPEWVAFSFFRGSSQPRDRTQVAGQNPASQADSLPAEPKRKAFSEDSSKTKSGPRKSLSVLLANCPPHQHQHNSWMQWCTEGWARGEICPGCRQ